ncbi:MAG TPA: hypothetical protein VF411_02335 [Bacteroidia bacterium]
MKVVYSLLFVLASFLSYSQDFIIKLDSNKIFCKITKEDSLLIYYIEKGDTELSIYKSNVYKYYNHVIGTIKLGSMVHVQPKGDSLKIKTAYLPPKKDSLVFIGGVGRMFKIGDEQFGVHRAMKLTKNNQEAHREMIGATWIRYFMYSAAFTAGVMAADFTIGAASGHFQWIEGGSSIILLGIAVTLEQEYHKHVHKAVKLYNSKIGIAGVPKFQLGMALSGIGISLKF